MHRGGPKGFVRILSPNRLAIADFRGNRQYMSVGNLAADNRVSLFFMDYPNRRRLKVMAYASTVGRDEDGDLIAKVRDEGYRAVIERAMVFDVEAFDWNCPQHITPRFTEDELVAAFEQAGRGRRPGNVLASGALLSLGGKTRRCPAGSRHGTRRPSRN